MPTTRYLRRSHRKTVTSIQMMELWLGPSHISGSSFESDEHRRETWFRFRDQVMRLWGKNGKRPMAWWLYEAAEWGYRRGIRASRMNGAFCTSSATLSARRNAPSWSSGGASNSIRHGRRVFRISRKDEFSPATLPANCIGYGRICRPRCSISLWPSASGAPGPFATCRTSAGTLWPRPAARTPAESRMTPRAPFRVLGPAPDSTVGGNQ